MNSNSKIGIFHLTLIGLTGCIGSGWLFAGMYASHLAGTGAFTAWLIGAILMLVIVCCLAELAGIYSHRGLLASICSFSHNRDFALIIALANWFGTLCVIPSEAIATARYLHWGTWSIILLIIIYSIVNHWGVKIFSKFNSSIAIFKILAIIITIIALLAGSTYHPEKFHSHELFNIKHIMTGLLTAGIIYGFNGCQMIVNFTSEAKHPKIDIPIALILSLLISLIMYLLLQFCFINIADMSIDYRNPYIQLAISLGMGWLVILLQADAIVSPSGTGITYMGSCTRMLTAMAKAKQMPSFIAVKNEKYQLSQRSLWINCFIAVLLFLVFQTWQELVVIVSSFHVISYLAAPLALARLRKTMPDTERVFSLPLYKIICPILFFVLSYLFSIAPVKNDIAITLLTCSFLLIYLVLNYRESFKEFFQAMVRASFIPIWLISFTICSIYNVNFIIIFILSMIFYYININQRLLNQ